MRGLKLTDTVIVYTIKDVASFTDAWIETIPLPFLPHGSRVASFTDAWIETPTVNALST